MGGLNTESERRWNGALRYYRRGRAAIRVLCLRSLDRAIYRGKPASPIECHGASHSRLHLILLRAMPRIAVAMGMAGGWVILAGLHDAARQTSSVGEHQCDREQDQNFARKTPHLVLD
jgi:hypothetical protein